ncbi:hypothetical protein J3Q64DRAFT_1744632 [Phycomyces blakesleeanus]|uniref:Secreted protein n=1 Tax=Phycomyces blakesleeanus TaxID=4837 RepID=A0ABR3AZS9_PHYBL
MHILLISVLAYVQICTVATAWKHPFLFQPKGFISGTQATSQEHLRSVLVSPSEEKRAMDHGIRKGAKLLQKSCFNTKRWL